MTNSYTKLPTVAALKLAARGFYGHLTNIDIGVRERACDPYSLAADVNAWATDDEGYEVDLGDIYPVSQELARLRKAKIWPVGERWDLYCYRWNRVEDGLIGNATLTFLPDGAWRLTEG